MRKKQRKMYSAHQQYNEHGTLRTSRKIIGVGLTEQEAVLNAINNSQFTIYLTRPHTKPTDIITTEHTETELKALLERDISNAEYCFYNSEQTENEEKCYYYLVICQRALKKLSQTFRPTRTTQHSTTHTATG